MQSTPGSRSACDVPDASHTPATHTEGANPTSVPPRGAQQRTTCSQPLCLKGRHTAHVRAAYLAIVADKPSIVRTMPAHAVPAHAAAAKLSGIFQTKMPPSVPTVMMRFSSGEMRTVLIVPEWPTPS